MLNHDMNTVSVCPAPRLCEHCASSFTGKSPRSMRFEAIRACSCSTHSNTVRGLVGSGTGDRYRSCASQVLSALAMVHCREVSYLIANPDTFLFSLLDCLTSLTKRVTLPPAWVRHRRSAYSLTPPCLCTCVFCFFGGIFF